jgi:hypothetical protein
MRRTRRAFIVFGMLLLIGGLHSYYVGSRETVWPQSVNTWSYRHGISGGVGTYRGRWAFSIFEQPKQVTPIVQQFGPGFLRIGVRIKPEWRIDAEGSWIWCAMLFLVPSLALELRTRRHGTSVGFPIEANKNPAHTGGVNTSRAS